MNRKIITFGVASLLCLGLTSCGGKCGEYIDNRPIYNTVEFKQPPFFITSVEITGWRYCPKHKNMIEISYTYKKDNVFVEMVMHTSLDNVKFIYDDNYYLK